MSPVMETVAVAAATLMAIKPIQAGGVGLLFIGLNCHKIPEAIKSFADNLMSLDDAKDKLLGKYDKKILCKKPDCGEMIRTSKMAEHLQFHIDTIINESKIADLLALETETTEAILSHENSLWRLRKKEEEELAKAKALNIEHQERQNRMDSEEKLRPRHNRVIPAQPFRYVRAEQRPSKCNWNIYLCSCNLRSMLTPAYIDVAETLSLQGTLNSPTFSLRTSVGFAWLFAACI